MADITNLEEMRRKAIMADFSKKQKEIIQGVLASEDIEEIVGTLFAEQARYKNVFLHLAILSEDRFQKCSYRQYKNGMQSIIASALGENNFQKILEEARGMANDEPVNKSEQD